MENLNTYVEFEEMRTQLNILTEKLNAERIISDKMVRVATQSRMRWLTIDAKLGRYIAPPIYVMLCISFYLLTQNIPFTIYSVLLFTAACIGQRIYSNDIADKNLWDKTLLEIVQKLARARKINENWYKFGVPLGGLWIIWCGSIMSKTIPNFSFGLYIGALIGLVFGFLIRWFVNRRFKSVEDNLIEVIEMEKNNE